MKRVVNKKKKKLTGNNASLKWMTIPFRHVSMALGKGELPLRRSKSTPKATWRHKKWYMLTLWSCFFF